MFCKRMLLRSSLAFLAWHFVPVAMADDIASGKPAAPIIARLGSMRFRHGANDVIDSVMFFPNNRRVASATQGSIRVWEIETGVQALQIGLECASHNCRTVLSPDGKLFASVSWHSQEGPEAVFLWDAATGRKRRELVGDEHYLTAMNFSADGRLLATGDNGGTIHLWEIATGIQQRSIKASKDWITRLVFSPDRSQLAAIAEVISTKERRPQHTLVLWDVATGRKIQTLPSGPDEPNCMAYSPDGRVLLSAGTFPYTVRCWRVADGRLLYRLDNVLKNDTVFAGVSAITLSPDGKLLAVRRENGELCVIDLGKATRVWAHVVNDSETKDSFGQAWQALAYSSDGQWVAGGERGTLALFEAKTGKRIGQPAGHVEYVRVLRFLPNGRLLTASVADRHVKVWDIRAQHELFAVNENLGGEPFETMIYPSDDYRFPLAVSADGRFMVLVPYDGSLRLVHLGTGRYLTLLEGSQNTDPDLLAITADNWVVAIAPDRYDDRAPDLFAGPTRRKKKARLRLWNAATGKEIPVAFPVLDRDRVLGGPPVCGLSPDGRLLAVGNWLYRLPDGRAIAPIPNQAGYVFAPAGTSLSAYDGKQMINLFETATGKRRYQLATDPNAGRSPWYLFTDFSGPALRGHSPRAFSANGQRFALATDRIRIWDLNNGQLATELKNPHSAEVTGLALSDDGRFVATAGRETMVYVMDLQRQ